MMEDHVAPLDDADLEQLTNVLLTGVLVGAGSLILQMANGASILVQCPFEVSGSSARALGHGESYETASLLFPFLNRTIGAAALGPSGALELRFGSNQQISIVPDRAGLESYVVRTSRGIVPVC
jgi:hypothetical protein